jgi:hypothetical protein
MIFLIDDYSKYRWYLSRSWQSGNYSKNAPAFSKQIAELSAFINGVNPSMTHVEFYYYERLK